MPFGVGENETDFSQEPLLGDVPQEKIPIEEKRGKIIYF